MKPFRGARIVAAATAFSFLLLACVATAQTNEGAIAGNVLDPSGAVVPNARIVAKGDATGVTYETISSSAGAYSFSHMTNGPYTLTATAPGFNSAVVSGVIVQVGTTSSLNINMQTGAVSQTVTVAGDAPTIETETSDIGTVVTTKQVLDLPLALGSNVSNMRSPEAFVFLTPGAVGPGTNGSASNGTTNGGAFQSKITGGQNYGTEILLDGASMYRSENGSSFDETAPSVEALGEFRVETSTMPAELGRTTGGIEIFSTKQGTNQFHGDAYDIFRNEDLDANTYNNNRLGLPRALDKQNDYGGTLGGPVWIPKVYNGRDKTFFFFSWEQYRQNQGGVSTSTVPTAAQAGGDFSSTLDTTNILGTNPCEGGAPIYFGEIFDPKTTKTVNGVQCRTSFLSETGKNAIPKNQLSPIGEKIIGYYPPPQNASLINNFALPFSFPILDTAMTFRIDQSVGTRDKMYFTYSSRDNNRLANPPYLPGPAGAGQNQDFFTHYVRFGNDFTITPALLDHLNLGFNRTNSLNVAQASAAGQDFLAQLGIAGATGTQFPRINPGELQTASLGNTTNNDTIDNGYRLNDTVDWVKGKHSMAFGVDARYQIFEPGSLNNTAGNINFARAETAGSNASSGITGQSGNGLASLLLGVVDNANLNAYASQPKWIYSYFAVFAQDSYKITPHLTLNYGLRWDVDVPRREAHGNTSNIDLSAPNPGAGGLPGALVFAGKGAGRNGSVNERWADIWYKDYAPRFGFAWSPGSAGNTVFRGGYGILYGANTYADFGNDLQTGFQANPTFNSQDGFNPAFNIASGFPSYNPPPNLNPAQSNFQGNPANAYIDPSYGRPAMIQNWSFEIQRQLATDLLLDVAYVGQHSTHLHSNIDPINALNPQYFALGSLLNASISSPQAAAAGIHAPFAGFPSTQTVAQALLPYPQFFGLNTDCCLENLGQATYNALQASVHRRFHSGLNLMAAYTWSRTLTDADSALPFFAQLSGLGGIQNPFNQRGEKAESQQDIPQNFVLSYIYELPVGKGKPFLNKGGIVNAVLGGWSISGVQTYHSGQPFSFCCANGIPAFNHSVRFNYVAGQQLFSDAYLSGHFDPVTDSLFNRAAFSDPNAPARIAAGGAYELGNMAREIGSIRSFFFYAEDFNLLKRTQITERSNLLLQVSFLNAFNRHIFDAHNSVDTNANNTDFGLLNLNNTLQGPRRIQLQLKFEF